MQKILILTGNYYPIPSANGICTHQIAIELKKLGYGIDILCLKKKGDASYELFEGLNIFRINMSLISRLRNFNKLHNKKRSALFSLLDFSLKFLNRVKLFLYFPLYPINSLSQILRYYSKAKSLQKKNNYIAVISVFNPIDSLIAGLLLKNRNPNIKFIPYFLDSIINSWGHKFINKKNLDFKGWKWEKILFPVSDFIIFMNYHRVEKEDNRYDPFRDKFIFLDIPLFRDFTLLKESSFEFSSSFNPNFCNITYTGRLELQQYDPFYAISLLENSLLSKNLKVHFFSKGNCEEKLRLFKLKNKDSIVNSYGFVKPKIAISALMQSDVLLSIGTRETNMIPSKIFEYISSKKPIIHVYSQKNDVCLDYFLKYPNSVVIYDKDDFFENVKKLDHFLTNTSSIIINWEEIKSKFFINSPQFTANYIHTLLRNR